MLLVDGCTCLVRIQTNNSLLISVADLLDIAGNAAGTKVTLQLPVIEMAAQQVALVPGTTSWLLHS